MANWTLPRFISIAALWQRKLVDRPSLCKSPLSPQCPIKCLAPSGPLHHGEGKDGHQFPWEDQNQNLSTCPHTYQSTTIIVIFVQHALNTWRPAFCRYKGQLQFRGSNQEITNPSFISIHVGTPDRWSWVVAVHRCEVELVTNQSSRGRASFFIHCSNRSYIEDAHDMSTINPCMSLQELQISSDTHTTFPTLTTKVND